MGGDPARSDEALRAGVFDGIELEELRRRVE
jgi:hypothetical protein